MPTMTDHLPQDIAPRTAANHCEHCRQEAAEVCATIPDDFRGDSHEALCADCYEEAKIIGAFLSVAYPANVKFMKRSAA